MARISAKLSTIGTKFQVGTAACALTAAALITPAVAQADPGAPLPLASLGSSAAGSSLVAPECVGVGSPNCNGSKKAVPSSSASGSASSSASTLAAADVSAGGILQNKWFWIGTPNPNPPADREDFLAFNPLPLIPGFLRPIYGWFTQNLNFEVCVVGLSVRVGPYGTVTGSYSRSGC